MIEREINSTLVRRVSLFFVVFYVVGVIGFVLPVSSPLFVKLTPLALLLSSIALFFFHSAVRLKTDIAIFVLIFFLGFFIEVLGVRTGNIFGNYEYGEALGFKLFNTPLLIGINWLFLTYTTTAITTGLKIKKWIAVFIAPIFMVSYDIVLEQVAPKMDMWSFLNSEVPIRNYIAWYIIGFCFVLLLKVFKIETKNPVAAILFVCQFVFLTFLAMFL